MTFSFKAAQFVALAHDRRLGQHARGLLEGRGRDERVGRQEALVMPSSTLAYVAGILSSARSRSFSSSTPSARPARRDEAAVARVGDLHAAQHLANDHLDVLVVDLHALQAVDVLHLVDDVARQRLDAQQAQDVVRIGRAVDDHLALVDHLAVVHQDVLLLGDQELVTLPSGR
jgi:hypothetical protein